MDEPHARPGEPVNAANGADRRRWWVLAAMGAVLGIVLLDETVIGVALPTISAELGLSDVAGHWVVNAYLLVFAVLAAAAGKLGDIVGLKRLFIAGVLTFGVASLLCGFAPGGAWLIAMRAVQGIGAAVIFPVSLAMVTISFPDRQRGMALGIYGAIGTTFLALGPFAGGLFTDLLSWRWIFWINPPIVVAIAAVIAVVWHDPPREGASERVDLRGLATLVLGLGALVFAVMQGPDWGWSALSVWLTLGLGLVMLTVFAVIESRMPAPLIEVDLFRNAGFTASNLVIFIAQFTKIAMFVFGALYLQNALGMNPLMAGTALLASVVPTMLTAAHIGRLADRVSARRLTLIGLLVSGAATLWIALAMTWQSYAALLPAMIVWGTAQNLLFLPSLRAVMGAVPAAKQGQAGGISMSAQLVGGTVGMAVCGAVFATTGSYGLVFLVTGLLTMAVLAFGAYAIEEGS